MADLLSFIGQFWTVWLILVFVGIVVWVFWPGRRKKMEENARIPFEDDERRS